MCIGPLLEWQPGVLRLGSLQDRNIRIRVLPQGQKILIGGSGFGRVARERAAARQTQVGNRIVQSPIRIEPGTTPTGALVIQDLLELGSASKP